MDFLCVGLGGFFGAIARYGVYFIERSVGSHRFPFGTLIINLSGCLIAGALLAIAERVNPANRQLLLIGSMGFVGSFTTFSTFGVETFSLLRSGQANLALASVSANLILGVVAVWLGRMAFLR